MFDSLKIAFATYSRIPTPPADWNEHSMKYAMCFFPLVGVVLALLSGLAWLVLTRLGLHAFFISSWFTALPIVLTGGIHLDGYFDTQDALHSYAPKGRKLEILKDPHIGAFAAIYGLDNTRKLIAKALDGGLIREHEAFLAARQPLSA